MKKLIHQTTVRVNLDGLAKELPLLRKAYDSVDPKGLRANTIQRSKFTTWNNLNHFYENNLMQKQTDGTVKVAVEGTQSGATARVYYKPSVTSLSKVFRKYIIPCSDDKVFAYADIKAAEFFLNCLFVGEEEALQVYYEGGDIYMHYADKFPPGTTRNVIKKSLIGFMYGLTSYTLAKQVGISETQADRILMIIERSFPRMTQAKAHRIAYCSAHNGYYCPAFHDGAFHQDELVKVADIDPKKGFQPNLALSAWIQSALGEFMQSFIHDLEPRVHGTILTVFDSVFVEIQPESLGRFKNYLTKKFAPFIFDEVKIGHTMYEAQEG